MRRFTAALVAAFLLPSLALAQVAPTVYTPLARKVASGSSDTATAADFQNGIFWKSTTGSNKTETLPACVAGLSGRWTAVADEQGTAATYPITVTAGAGTVNGSSNGFQITSNLGSAVFQCDGTNTNWVVRSQFAPGTNVRAVSGTSDTIAPTDNGNVVRYTSSSAVSVSLQAGTATAGFTPNAFTFMALANGSGGVTFNLSGGTANYGTTMGASSLTLSGGQLGIFILDGSGNYTVLIGANAGVTASSLTTNTLPKATGTAALGNSSVSDNGTTVSTSEPVSSGGLTSSGNVYAPSPSVVTGSANIDPTSTAMCGGVLPYSSVSAGTLTFLSTWPAGCNVSVEATSSGLATIAAGAGATLHTACTTARTRAQYSMIWLHGESTGVVNVSGDCG